jgi:hypothetical protein
VSSSPTSEPTPPPATQAETGEAILLPPLPAAARHERWRLPVSTVLAAGFGGLVAAAVGAVLWLSLDAARIATRDLLQQTAMEQIDGVVENLDHHLAPARSQIDFLVRQLESGAVAPEDDARLKDLLLGTLAATPQVTGIAFVRDDLHAVWAGLEGGQYSASSGSWVDRAEVGPAPREAPPPARPQTKKKKPQKKHSPQTKNNKKKKKKNIINQNIDA